MVRIVRRDPLSGGDVVRHRGFAAPSGREARTALLARHAADRPGRRGTDSAHERAAVAVHDPVHDLDCRCDSRSPCRHGEEVGLVAAISFRCLGERPHSIHLRPDPTCSGLRGPGRGPLSQSFGTAGGVLSKWNRRRPPRLAGLVEAGRVDCGLRRGDAAESVPRAALCHRPRIRDAAGALSGRYRADGAGLPGAVGLGRNSARIRSGIRTRPARQAFHV